MPFQQFELENFVEWGKLVKDWSRGIEDRPTDLKTFIDLLNNKRHVEATIDPTKFDKIVYRDHEERVIFINVPPKKMIDDAEAELKDPTKPYIFAPFYAVDMKDPTLNNNTPAGKLEFHHERVGEYTVRFCG